jgi:hypothetical protein
MQIQSGPQRLLTRRQGLAWGVGAAVLGSASAQAMRGLRVPRPQHGVLLSQWYPYALLRAALDAAAWPHQLLAREGMNHARARVELLRPDGLLDIMVAMGSRTLAEQLHWVPVPLYRGLFGWRLLLVKQGQAKRLAGIKSLDDLRALRFLQGADWPDTEILRANGLHVETASQTPSLHKMLEAGRGDCFPRGVPEVWRELNENAGRFEVVPGLALHYRADLFFFVRRTDTELAQALTRGLTLLQRNGKHDALLLAHHGAALTRSQLPQRRVIELPNDLLGTRLAGESPALWKLPEH